MKPSRKTLREALAVNVPAASSDTFAAEPAATEVGAARRGILVRVSPELRRALKLEAIARNATMQDLLLEAIAVVLKQPAAPPKP